MVRRAALMALALAMLAACAPDASDQEVRLEAVSPEARAARDAALEGRTQRTPPGSGESPANIAAAGAGTNVGAPVEAVTPRSVPARPAGVSAGDNVVAFALATSHAVGEAVYPRESGSEERQARACGRYASDDLAQQAFLAAGGPDADPRGMDPDGDGYACGWDPERFRRAVE